MLGDQNPAGPRRHATRLGHRSLLQVPKIRELPLGLKVVARRRSSLGRTTLLLRQRYLRSSLGRTALLLRQRHAQCCSGSVISEALRDGSVSSLACVAVVCFFSQTTFVVGSVN